MADFAEEIKNLSKSGNDDETQYPKSAESHHSNSESLVKMNESSPLQNADSLQSPNGIVQQHGVSNVKGDIKSSMRSLSETESEIIDVESHQEETGSDAKVHTEHDQNTGNDSISHIDHAQNTGPQEHEQNSEKEVNGNDLPTDIVANQLGNNSKVRVLNIMPISEESSEDRNAMSR